MGHKIISRSVLSCLRLLWNERRFFTEEHASHSMAAVLRSLSHYAGSGSYAAVELCLHFLCDLLDGTEQLLACLNALASILNTNPTGVLSSGLVLHALVSYQPDNLALRGTTAVSLVEVMQKWFSLIMGALNHSVLMGDIEISGMSYVVVCQLGIDILRYFYLKFSEQDNQSQIATEEYGVFLKFLLLFLQENANREVLFEFCDVLYAKNYLTLLPHAQIERNDLSIRKISTIILGEMLKSLADKYLNIDEVGDNNETYARDIQMSSISNGSLQTLDERVYLEKAIDRLVYMLQPDPSLYYTHNPAILLWCFTSQRIPNYVRLHVLSQWLLLEDSIPCDLTTDPAVWELLLNILVQNKYKSAIMNCKEALQQCLEDGTEDDRRNFAGLVWGMLPNVLSKTLIDYDSEIGKIYLGLTNIVLSRIHLFRTSCYLIGLRKL
ncbi:unnamed protein product [Diatraea saccharalis]|uniref:Uncharacterized protein n=1 Tax=Diatraea saccharalis TaxID=40085 RepID=A0A9N9RFC3_9NEOP|nr:unnamed protein product [Diatraea saccharalis]